MPTLVVSGGSMGSKRNKWIGGYSCGELGGEGAMNLVQQNVTVSQLRVRESSIIGVQWHCE
eukprot:scaffold10817_cov75-Cyclotella_meneghiniana.AAC.1